MIDNKRTGQRIREICKLRGITVKHIQHELHIGAYQSVYAWLEGKTLPSLDNFYCLSRMLGLPMENLIVSDKECQILKEVKIVPTRFIQYYNMIRGRKDAG